MVRTHDRRPAGCDPVSTSTETWVDTALRLSPVQAAFRWSASRRLAVLAYHGVDDPERFAQHLDHVRRTASALSIEEALEAFEGRRPLPKRAVLITFDDGHRSVLEAGLPLLRERGLPAVAFVIAGLLDTDRPFWWSEVAELARRGGVAEGISAPSPRDVAVALKRVPDERRRAAIQELRATADGGAEPAHQLSADEVRTLESAGVAIGNHTWSHPCLSRCEDEVVRREIEKSHVRLTEVLGHAPIVFAYPDGDRDARAVSHLRGLGYRAAFLFDHRLSAERPADPFAVSRLRINSDATVDRMQTIASGLHPSLLRARRRV